MSISDLVNQMVIGSGVIFAGTLIGRLFDTILRGILTSYLSPADFGIYSLALTVISITGAVATLGLSDGVPRYIAYFRGRNEEHKIHEIIVSAMIMGLIASLLAVLVSPVFLERLAAGRFDLKSEILPTVRILIFAIPFTILLNVTVAIYRGFNQTNINMYFYNIIRPVSFLGFAFAAVFFSASLRGIVFADLFSMIFTFCMMSVYFIKKPPIKPELKLKFSEPTRKLMRYSFPLLITSTLLSLMTWTDTIMLGYFKPAEVVGVYNAVYPLVGFLTIIINSIGFVYVPAASKLWGENRTESISSIYQIMTKWCFLLTFPVFVLMFVYPEFLLTKLYGEGYATGAPVLRILSLGFIANSYFGFNYHTLLASGDSDFLMKCSVASAGINVILNFILIPEYSMAGAAIASSASYAAIEVLMTLRTWKKENMHPFTSMYRKLTLICTLLAVSMFAAKEITPLSEATWEYAVFVIMYFLIIQYTNILDKNEVSMLSDIQKSILYNIGVRIPGVFKIRA